MSYIIILQGFAKPLSPDPVAICVIVVRGI